MERQEKVAAKKTNPDSRETKPEAKPKPELLNPAESQAEAGDKPRQSRIVRTLSERSRFYTHQDDSKSCSAFSFGMMAADHLYGRPVKHGSEAQYFKELAGTINHGYRGDLKSVEAKLQKIGLDAKAYEYGFGKVSRESLKDLNRELDQGKSAVVKVINPTTKNPHYIYVAGRDKNGDYIVGDPARSNRTNSAPVSPDFLYSMMRQRDGFVVGGAPKDSAGRVFNVPSTEMSRRRNR
ncbi:MAG: hypothetical protein BWY75_03750 [bacterium ADurb.Bin425]|nr:MAG: hypothetical protein BWY75_03750 [bacterium ADurb.Bin425]